MFGEARCCRHEVAGARRHDALPVQCGGQGVADAFDPGRVTAGRHKRRNAGTSEDVECGAGLAGRATPVRTTYAAGHRLGQRSIFDAGCSRKAQELPQDGRVRIESYGYGLELGPRGFGHGGDMLGHVSHVRVDLESALGVVACANGFAGAWWLGEGALAICAGGSPPAPDLDVGEPLVDGLVRPG